MLYVNSIIPTVQLNRLTLYNSPNPVIIQCDSKEEDLYEDCKLQKNLFRGCPGAANHALFKGIWQYISFLAYPRDLLK